MPLILQISNLVYDKWALYKIMIILILVGLNLSVVST